VDSPYTLTINGSSKPISAPSTLFKTSERTAETSSLLLNPAPGTPAAGREAGPANAEAAPSLGVAAERNSEYTPGTGRAHDSRRGHENGDAPTSERRSAREPD